MAGDSIEGIWRLKKIGSRSKKPIKQTRIKISLPDEDKYGEFQGLILYADFSQKDSLYLPAQVVISKGSVGNRHYLLEEMIDDEIAKIDGKFGLYAHNKDEYDDAMDRMLGLGKKFDDNVTGLPQTAVNDEGKLEVEIAGTMDTVIFRTIAKIAFNYLSKIRGAKYALNSKFDVIRDYIRGVNGSGMQLVEIQKGHILADETTNKYFLDGHIFTIETRGRDIVSKVCLTNSYDFYYVVKLGDLGPIWHDISSGHAYSLENDKMISLFSPTFLTIMTKLKRIFG
ncbi:MAG: hypothetical protein P9L88_04755 [Candidatus Tantalella remota]|nr:hypothetical protein [Candidatus Tantalella remota]